MINNAATSFGGAFTSFAGSNLAFTASEFSDNVSGFYGGGLLALYGNATVTFSKINRNRFAIHNPPATPLPSPISSRLLLLWRNSLTALPAGALESDPSHGAT